MKTFDKVAWALVAAVAATFLLVGCSGGGTSAETVKVEIPTTKAIAGLVRSTDGVATVVLNNAVVGEKLRLTIEEDRDADAARLVVQIPSQALRGIRGAPARRQETAAAGGLVILITDPTGSIIFVSVQASVDFSGSKPSVAIAEGGVIAPDSDSDGAPNWLEVFLQTNPNNASDVPTQAAIDGANETLTQGFADAIATGKTTTAGADPQAGTSTGEPVSTTPITATGEPNTTLTAKPGAFSKVNSVSFKFATDTGVKFDCSLDGAEFAPCASPQSYSALPEGRHTFKVRAASATGTPDATPASHTWTVDTVVPAASISGLSTTPVSSSSVTATLNCSEPNCAFLCSVDGSVLAGCNASHLMSGLKDGDHTLKASAVDEAGNEQADPAVGTFKTDTTLPSKPDAAKVTLSQNAPGSEDQLSGSAGAVEAGSSVRIYSDGLLTAKLGEAIAKTDGSFDAVNIGDNKGDSTDKVYVVQIDLAGNQSPVESLTNDKTAPAAGTIVISDSTSGSTTHTNSTGVTLTLTGPADAAAWLVTEGGAPAPTASGWATTKPTGTTLSTTDAAKTVKLYTKDAAHNMSAVASGTIALDTAAPANPTLTLKDADCPACTASNAVGINVTITGDTDAVAWFLAESQATAPAEGASGWASSRPVSLTLSTGEASKTVYIWTKDVAGNINTTAVSQTIILDTTNPGVSALTLGGTAVSCSGITCLKSGAFTVSTTVTDGGSAASGVASCQYSQDGGTTWTTGSLVGSTCSVSNPSCTDGTTMTVNMRTTDNAGNVGTGTAISPAPKCDAAAPTFGGLTSASATSTTAISLGWSTGTDSNNVTAQGDLVYDICQSTTYQACVSSFTATYTSTAGATTYNVNSGLTQGKRYFFVVRARDLVGYSDSNSVEMSASTWSSGIVQAVAARSDKSCSLFSDGTVRCWGSNSNGQLGDGTTVNKSTPISVSTLTNAVAVAGGNLHTCALLADGTVKCWGQNSYGQLGEGTTVDRWFPYAVSSLTTAVAVAPGASNGCALYSNGGVKCWGRGNLGQLGDGTTEGKLTPVPVSTLTNVVAVTGGSNHTCSLLADGTVRCWGSGSFGKLGDGTTVGKLTAVAVSTLTNAVAVAGGSEHSCALISDGSVRCWGRNADGALGVGTTVDGWMPSPVSSLTNAVAVTGGEHTCSLLADGTVRCWGDNLYGELGDGTTVDKLTPVAVSMPAGPMGMIAVNHRGPNVPSFDRPFGRGLVAGGSSSCALVSDRTARCWGANTSGQLGDGTTTARLAAVPVTSLTGIMGLAAGGSHACALLAGGSVKCWGSNSNGQLGDGTAGNRLTPTAVTSLSGAGAVHAGSIHSCAIAADGKVWCWGKNDLGQVGDGTTTDRYVPIAVSTLTNVASVAVGGSHACAYDASAPKTVRCWGSNASGQLGDDTTLNRFTPVAVSSLTHVEVHQLAAGESHTCSLSKGAVVQCWGSNAYGQIGDGSAINRLTPIAVSSLSNVLIVAAGSAHSCALLSDGTVKCWGRNTSGQLGDGTTADRLTPIAVSSLSNVVAIAVDSVASHTCALLVNGTVKCWGVNTQYQVGDGTTASKSTPVQVLNLP